MAFATSREVAKPQSSQRDFGEHRWRGQTMRLLRGAVRTVVAAVILMAAAHLCLGQDLEFTPYKARGIYSVGEKVGWTVKLKSGTVPSGDYGYTVKKNNQDVIKSGKLDFSSGRAA